MRAATLAIVILALVIPFGFVGPSAAGLFVLGGLFQVSGTSPFVSCTADNVGGQSGTNFLHSEVEPWIAVNPTTPSNIVGIWQQDRWSNGGARGLVASRSADGGASWTSVVIPGITKCSPPGIYDRSTDPWVTFSPNGIVHQLALSFNDLIPPLTEDLGGDFDHALLYSRSMNGGLTWSSPVEVIRDLDANAFNDKQSITADPFDSNYVYAVWDRLVFPPSERASIIAGLVTAAFRGPTWFARTTDGGDTWEARLIYDPGQQKQTIGNQIAVLPSGDLVNVFDLITQTRGAVRTGAFFNVALIRSQDRGETWGPRERNGKVSPIIVNQLRTIGVRDPETGDPVRTGDVIPDVAVAPNGPNGNLYIVWQDARPNGLQADAIVMSKSTDGGLTWSPFIKVNKTPTNIPLRNQQAFTPSVHVAADGTVAVTYYDFRNNDGGEDLKTDYWIVHCHASVSVSCTDASQWTEQQLTTASFDMRQAPLARGFFTGDYEGLASADTVFVPFWSQSHPGDPASIFFRRVVP